MDDRASWLRRVLPKVTEFCLFRPVVDVSTKRIYAYEALVRRSNGESAATVLGQVTETNRYALDQAYRVEANPRQDWP